MSLLATLEASTRVTTVKRPDLALREDTIVNTVNGIFAEIVLMLTSPSLIQCLTVRQNTLYTTQLTNIMATMLVTLAKELILHLSKDGAAPCVNMISALSADLLLCLVPCLILCLDPLATNLALCLDPLATNQCLALCLDPLASNQCLDLSLEPKLTVIVATT